MPTAEIPQSHQDLMDAPFCAALTTIMPDGHPQTTPVWYNRDGDCILINTMQGFRKEKNMRLNPKVTLLIYDPANPLHNIEIRGLVVEMTEVGAVEHLNALTAWYLKKPNAQFFGDSVSAELHETYHPVKITIQPVRVRAEG